MSFDWQSYWARRLPLREGTVHEALVQVGETRFGQPVATSQLDILVDHIVDLLDLKPHARALDLGCGNGLVTYALAGRIAHVVGFDYSPALLATARSHFMRPNLIYREADLRKMEGEELTVGSYDSAWSIEVVQNLDPVSLTALLKWLARVMTSRFRFLASGIPDISRIRAFYDTEERWQRHLENAKAGREQMGYWWSTDELAAAADCARLNVRFDSLPRPYYTSRYRLEAMFWRD